MTVTVVRPDDLADRILDRDKHPQWQGERTRMVYSFPTNEALWARYAEIRAEGLRADRGLGQATAFYKRNRKKMDEGASVAWPARFNHDELSAVQHAMNLKLQDEAAFWAEYQNEPLPEVAADDDLLTPEQIAAKTNGMPRSVAPIGCTRATAFIDVQGKLLFWLVAGWEDDFTGYVLDYGAWPAALNSAWLEARRFFVSTAQSMWYGALAAAQIVLHALEVGWIETTSFLSKTWSRFTGGFQKAWESASSFVAKRMLEIQGLFDSGLDVEAAKKAVDQQLEQRLGEIDERTRAAVAEREARRSAERDRASELNDATLAQIGQQYEDAQKALDARTDARITDAQRELEAARQRLDEAIAEAKRRREEAGAEPGPSGSPRDLLGEFENRLQAVGDLVAQGISVRGTFNARAVQGLASDSGAAERTARATEQTAKHIRQLADAARGGGLTFA
jgi:hypothetical protein